MGALTPIGNNLHDYWNNLLIGKSGAAQITKFDTSKHKVHFACELKGFDPAPFFDPKEFKKIDPKTWGFTAVSTYGFDAYVKGRCATNCWIVSVTFLPLFIFHLWMMMGPL